MNWKSYSHLPSLHCRWHSDDRGDNNSPDDSLEVHCDNVRMPANRFVQWLMMKTLFIASTHNAPGDTWHAPAPLWPRAVAGRQPLRIAINHRRHSTLFLPLSVTDRKLLHVRWTLWCSAILHWVSRCVFSATVTNVLSVCLSAYKYRHNTLQILPDLKLISFTNPFLHSHSYSFRTDFTDLNLYWIKGALFVCFSFWLRVL